MIAPLSVPSVALGSTLSVAPEVNSPSAPKVWNDLSEVVKIVTVPFYLSNNTSL